MKTDKKILQCDGICKTWLLEMILRIIAIRTEWAASWQNQQNDCAPSEDSDQPGHPPSLIRVFAVRMKKTRVLSYPLSAQRRLWSDWADAQADLRPRWVHMPLYWFCHEAAHMALFPAVLSRFFPTIGVLSRSFLLIEIYETANVKRVPITW